MRCRATSVLVAEGPRDEHGTPMTKDTGPRAHRRSCSQSDRLPIRRLEFNVNRKWLKRCAAAMILGVMAWFGCGRLLQYGMDRSLAENPCLHPERATPEHPFMCTFEPSF